MKIVLFDPYLRKFTSDMERWWIDKGHEVKVDRYYDPQKVLWADVVWFDTADNNIKSATNPSEALLDDDANFKPWDMHEMDLSKKKIICRPIDIEVWQGAQNGVDWSLVNDVIFIAPHIRDLMELPPSVKIHVIPHSVNLDRYTFKSRKPGKDIAIVSEKWTSKGTDLILQIALRLPDYKFHWLGRWSDHTWEQRYFEEFIEHHKLNFTFTEWIDGENAVNDFLEDKNYLLHASHKEAFSMATAEAMAKGIKPILHRFYGADKLWPGLTWSSIDEAVEMIKGDYDSESYRQYLIDKGYITDAMMKRIDDVIRT